MINCFQHLAKLGRHIILNKNHKHFVMKNYWNAQGIPNHFLRSFWGQIWYRQIAQRIMTFQWLLFQHRVLVGMLIYHPEVNCPICQSK